MNDLFIQVPPYHLSWQQIIVTIITIICSSGLALWFFNRPAQKRQMATQLLDASAKLFTNQETLIKNLEGKIDELEAAILKNKGDISALSIEAAECKYRHRVAKLEMEHLKSIYDFSTWKKDKVFVLEDDLEDLDIFTEKFSDIAVLHYEGFSDEKIFMREVKSERPPILVIDYRLAGGRTAEDVIAGLDYEPEIFIMSGARGYETRFKGKNVYFFYKEENYIFKIAEAIITHLLNKKKDKLS